MLIDHIEIPVTDADAARRFYETGLAPLGVTCVLSVPAERSASGTPRHGLAAMAIRAFGYTVATPRPAGCISPLPQ